jgi:c-di-GMP-related signal transduction protein
LRFVARQPILTGEEKVFGYELLFRDGIEDYFCPKDAEAASKIMLDSSLIMGLDVLCNGGRAFVNCTRDMLLKHCDALAVESDHGRDPGKRRTR